MNMPEFFDRLRSARDGSIFLGALERLCRLKNLHSCQVSADSGEPDDGWTEWTDMIKSPSPSGGEGGAQYL